MTAGERPLPPGGWVVEEAGSVDTVRAFCDFCGWPLTRRYRQIERSGQTPGGGPFAARR